MYNYEAYNNGYLDTVDVATIAELGDEGIPYLVKLAGDADSSVAERAKTYLRNAIIVDYYDIETEYGKGTIAVKKYDDIEEFYVSRSIAYDALDSYIKHNPSVLEIGLY